MLRPVISLLPIALLLCLSGCGSSGSGSSSNNQQEPEQNLELEHLSGGDATVLVGETFSKSSANLRDADKRLDFGNGDHFFENPWVQGSQSTQGRDGLGPYFNSNACQGCHIHDGRGHAGFATPDTAEQSTGFDSLLIRVSKAAGLTAQQQADIAASLVANVGDSLVGGQLQQRATSYIKNQGEENEEVVQVLNEAELAVSYVSSEVAFADGFKVSLREPVWHMSSNFGSFDAGSVFSARVAPPMIGLGLLELIDAADIYNQQDINDADGDGISGKANTVWSLEESATALGRFGLKAGQPSLLEQSAGAFAGDMGLTSRFHSEESCGPARNDCLNAPSGTNRATESNPDAEPDPYEVTDSILSLITFYSHHLGVPKRRDAYSEQVQQGKALFFQLGCENCHTQSYTTGSSTEFPELSNQLIFPYTDMLLHNMGEALADFDKDSNPVSNCADLHKDSSNDSAVRVEFQATACEWRTPPLWGIGLAQQVDPDATFLHDGRARNILEAVLWHGGEAEAARDSVLQLTELEREALLAFLNDL